MIVTQLFDELEQRWHEQSEDFARKIARDYSRFLDEKLEVLCQSSGATPHVLAVEEGECVLYVRLHDGREAKFLHGMFIIDGYCECEAIPSTMLCRYFEHYVEPLTLGKPFPAEYRGKYHSKKFVRVA